MTVKRVLIRDNLLGQLATYMRFDHEYKDIYDDPDDRIRKIMLKAYCDAKRALDEDLYVVAKKFVTAYEEGGEVTDKELIGNDK